MRTKRATAKKGTAVLIGGAEDKSRASVILNEVARRAGAGPLVVCTAGSGIPDELAGVYGEVFRHLGVRDVWHLGITAREHADDPKRLRKVEAATAFFFTGGDQLRITSTIAGSKLHAAIQDLFAKGGVVAGTSAGASALGHTMPVSTVEDEHRMAAAAQLVPGLGLLQDLIVDQHFAQRGRMGRLVAGVAENPRLLGIGLDENTGVVWSRGRFKALGRGAVYVVDGREMSRSNVGSGQSVLSVFDVRLHVLSSGDAFDVVQRRPVSGMDGAGGGA